jgi:PhnB protein
MSVRPIPEGFHTITPYLAVTGVDKLLEFLKAAFGAEESHPPMRRPDGTIMHAQVRIGDSRVMLGEPRPPWGAMPASMYVYVADCDATFRRAIQAGGVSIAEPITQFYGDRHGGVKDPSGNLWWIATHVEDVSSEELERRSQAALKSAR